MMTLPFHEASYEEQISRLTRAAHNALAAFDLQGAALRLGLYVNNAVFMVEHETGRFALRIHRRALKRREWIESALTWLEAMQRDTGLCTPRPRRTRDGALLAEADVDGIDEPLFVSLLGWLEGHFYQPAELSPDQVWQVGAFLGALHQHSAAYAPPPGFMLPRLDWEGLFGQESPYNPGDAASIFTSEQTAVFERVAERVRQTMIALDREHSQFGLIHADLIAKNYLFNGSSVCAIDFDDCAFGYYLYDLAPPLLQFSALPGYAQLKDALWRGYTSVRPQPDERRPYLEAFIAARHVASCRWIAGNLDHPNVRLRAPEIIRDRVAELVLYLETGTLERRSAML